MRWTCAAALVAVTTFGAANARAQMEGDPEVAEQLRRRAAIRPVHRAMGLTTWLSIGATAAIGTIRYANAFGFFGPPLCASGGSPIFGQEFGCGDGLRIVHLVTAGFTESSYTVTRLLAGLMPDPLGAASGGTAHSRRLWVHRALSYLHLLGMIAMPALGIATSLSGHDPELQRTLATAHMIVGYSTFGLVTIAGSLMIF